MDRVIVIWSNQEYGSDYTLFPPIGAVGTVVEPEDRFGELEVVFDRYPFPLLSCDSWTVHKSMIVRLGRNVKDEEQSLVDWKPEQDIYLKDNQWLNLLKHYCLQ